MTTTVIQKAIPGRINGWCEKCDGDFGSMNVDNIDIVLVCDPCFIEGWAARLAAALDAQLEAASANAGDVARTLAVLCDLSVRVEAEAPDFSAAIRQRAAEIHSAH